MEESEAAERRALHYDLGEGLLEIALVLSSLYFIARKMLFPVDRRHRRAGGPDRGDHRSASLKEQNRNHRWTLINTDNRTPAGSYLCLSVSICGSAFLFAATSAT